MLGSQALQQQRSADMHSLVRAAFILCIRRHDEAEFDNLGKLFGPSWGRGKRCQMSLGSGEGEEEKGGALGFSASFWESSRLVSVMERRRCRLASRDDPGSGADTRRDGLSIFRSRKYWLLRTSRPFRFPTFILRSRLRDTRRTGVAGRRQTKRPM